ncbi:Cobalt-zinc-cadmium resistance protein [Bathymodiolus heckerae thiotrophic gill symbiont]|uniref:cation diffusion facilitator family transporter n=1 Tax=Bathymodiolus heckerae thiotrophic gill symbiont TaxID=1052212 RepID=UPI0010BB8494|nr:cation diffusion facilitator family transporter [Bathymodiolus heckerae thiotrophic gill symbiont]CAC9434493.1 Cobalt-zinc-cadmium resistance protein [uncultured Gammaproteobacteria bacterium]SMN12778.1 Cobalt-zinc-cadmium resistance protein [Bathymodiolus heckerae thiotrophic gill symbiont]SMN14455.1 Cobalt-zinc-cadmium resistance protein [uncultured Candidatus Thioglobus sp.]
MNSHNKTKASQKVTFIGAIVDLLLAILKVIAGVLGNSGALIADGIHSFSDLLSDGIVLYAVKHAAEEADEEHPYGHKRFETVATLGLAIILAIVGVGVIFDAFERLNNPSVITHSTLLLSVAVLSIFSKEVLYWYTLKVAKTYKSDMLKANAWHHRSDALSSVVVFVGVLGSINGYPYLDGVAAIVVGLMVVYIAWELGVNATKELVDTSINAEQVEQLKQAIGMISGVNNVHSLRTRKIGSAISADVHVQVDPFLSVSEGHIISVSVERAAKECLEELSDVTVHIDPEDDETVAPCEHLPERAEALGILNKTLFNNQCDGEIERIQLHYLDGKIHVDFYLPLSCLSADISHNDILNKLTKVIKVLPAFGNIKVYFS